jgi:hypothetical protein
MVSVFSIGIFSGSGLPAFGLGCRANLAFPFLFGVLRELSEKLCQLY